MFTFIYLLCSLLVGYLTFNVLYIFVFAFAGRYGKADDTPLSKATIRLRRIAVLIPAYKEDAVITDSVEVNLRQTYPNTMYDLIVIADSFQPQTLERLSQYPIKVVPVQFEQSTVQKSISYVLNALPENMYDVVVISDADNHMEPDFLDHINRAFDQGFRAVQGHRTAKNTNTSVAIFDAMNEEVNNTFLRAGQRALGCSATPIGSGMAFEPTMMKRALNELQTVSGYDKELEMLLGLQDIPMAYLKNAVIYDEKVQNIAVFKRQRTRWVAAQMYFIKAYFKTGIKQLFKGNWQVFNALAKALLLPRMLLLAALVLLVLISLVVGEPAMQWFAFVMLGLFGCGLFIAIPTALIKKVSIRDFAVLPSLIFGMFRSLFKFREAGKKFIHTPHTGTSELI
jgi:cellulose synthase/poly-beta-1,6-N-acetylglucosamine synthase-like glycosyltransferase